LRSLYSVIHNERRLVPGDGSFRLRSLTKSSISVNDIHFYRDSPGVTANGPITAELLQKNIRPAKVMFTPHYVCLCLLEEHLDKLSTDFDDIFCCGRHLALFLLACSNCRNSFSVL